MLPCPVARRNWSAQMTPAAKKTTAKVPKNSTSNFWVRLYTQCSSGKLARSGWCEIVLAARDSTEFTRGSQKMGSPQCRGKAQITAEARRAHQRKPGRKDLTQTAH